MAKYPVINIPLTEDISLTAAELLKATFQAIISLRCDCSSEWDRSLRELQSEGWDVNWRLKWVAEARRGTDYEQACGATLDEVFSQLQQLTRLDAVAGCP